VHIAAKLSKLHVRMRLCFVRNHVREPMIYFRGGFGMSAVYEYRNFTGTPKHRSWNPVNKQRFNALIKCYVSKNSNKMEVIEKPSSSPATFHQCCLMAEKIKQQYGATLKQILIWDLDALEEIKRKWEQR
jgi:hypothetical protein